MGTKRRRPRRPRAFDRTIQHQHKRTNKMTKLHAVLVGSLLLAGGSGAMAQASDPIVRIQRIPGEIISAAELKPVLHTSKCPGPECNDGDPTNCVFRGDCYKYVEEGGRRLQDADEKQAYDALVNVAGNALHNADPAHIKYAYLPDVGEPGLRSGPALEFSFGRRLMVDVDPRNGPAYLSYMSSSKDAFDKDADDNASGGL